MEMSRIILSFLILGFVAAIPVPPEAIMRTDEIIVTNGYPVETHEVQTDDGYILTMFRIPHGKSSSHVPQNRKLFFIQHGLIGSSSNFVTGRPDIKCLAFLLADKGYDVWLGNTRGNRYSAKHAFLEISEKDYWNFTFDDMAAYDIPAMLNYALKTANQKHLYYAGHSQGTLLGFAAFSENKDLRQRVKGMFAMAPIAQLKNIDYKVRMISRAFYGMQYFVDKMSLTKLYPTLDLMKTISNVVCPISSYLCRSITQLSVKYTRIDQGRTPSPLYLSNLPEGTSIKNIYHYCQLIASGLFQKYDYGYIGNLVSYHTINPPLFNLKNIDLPVTLFSGSEDNLSAEKDVDWLEEQLPRVVHRYVVKGYNHVDFYWSVTAKQKIYDRILDIVENEIEK